MKKYCKKLSWMLLIGIILINVIAYNHAYKFTHFSEGEGKRLKPEDLSISTKIKLLFTGVNNPKPRNDKFPEAVYKTIEIQSHKKLEGWLIEVENSQGMVILFHGYSGSKSGIINYGAAFNRLGYSTLMMDFMGSGGSEGLQTTIGYKESRDVKEAYEYIKKNYPNDKIILFGSSMGAVSIIKSIDQYEINPNKIIIECPFGSMRATIQERFKAMKIPSFPFTELLMFYGGLQNGFNSFNHNPTEYAKQIKIKTLLIHGAKDKRVSMEEINEIYQNIKEEKELLILENSGHENYLINSKNIWEEKVSKFINE